MSDNKDKTKKKEIVKTWLAGQHSCTLVILKDFAESYELAQPSHVVVEGRPDGYFDKKARGLVEMQYACLQQTLAVRIDEINARLLVARGNNAIQYNVE